MTKQEYLKQWREKNKKKQKNWHKEYYQKNKETLLLKNQKYHKKWYQENKEKKDAKNLEWIKKHPTKRAEHVKKYETNNVEKLKNKNKEYQQTDAGLYRTTKYNSIKRGKEFNLSNKEFSEILRNKCNYCGEDIKRRGIDRVDNNKGYTKENSVACCKICNYMKRGYSVEEFFNHIKKVYKYNSL